ncbi:hypothetical protein [Nonomuraea sp. NPDC049400]|uniref:hypothetical protein n=1 Tax=Nonomuraea sp. NPDC049400 TaxID=3364352 RepID=UPI0037A62708
MAVSAGAGGLLGFGGGEAQAGADLVYGHLGDGALVAVAGFAGAHALAFVLHDMFAAPFQEIGHILGKSADATKMIASRASRKVQATDRPPGPGREHQQVVQAFRAAAVATSKRSCGFSTRT